MKIKIIFTLLFTFYFFYVVAQSPYLGENYNFVLSKYAKMKHETVVTHNTIMLNVRLSTGNYVYYFDQDTICYQLLYFVDEPEHAEEIKKMYSGKYSELAESTWLMNTLINGNEEEVIIQKQKNFFVFLRRKDADGW